MKRNKHLILVIGPAHSGTSVLTKGLETMGVSLGPSLTLSSPFEQKLHWEDPDVHTLNFEMILSFGKERRREILPLSCNEVETLVAKGFLERASQLLLGKFPKHQPLGIKDPRFSILFPFWERVFQHNQITLSLIIALRHPGSTTATQAEHVEKSSWIWISYLLASLDAATIHQSLIVDYDTLLSDPAYQMRRIARILGLSIVEEDLRLYCQYYVDLKRRHFYETKMRSTSLPFYRKLAFEIYEELRKVATDELDLQDLREPLLSWKKALQEISSLLVLAEKKHARIKAQREEIQQLDQTIHQLHKESNQQTYAIAHYSKEIHRREVRLHALLQQKRELAE